MSSIPLEHDYIGLAESSSMESSDKISSSSSCTVSSDILNLKETELRLGLPGSVSLDRKATNGSGLSLSLTPLKNPVSGAKRGFSDAIDGSSGNWVFSMGKGSEVDKGKGATSFTPRGSSVKPLCGSEGRSSGVSVAAIKEGVHVPQSSRPVQEMKSTKHTSTPAAKAQVVGWPPIRSYRKNTMASNLAKNTDDAAAEGKLESACLYVKVSMDGAPYLRKVDLKIYANYQELSSALEKMFSCFTIGQCGSHGLPGQEELSEICLKDLLHGSEYVLTYEDKDGDWMLVGDVPWAMFTDSCKRLRIMKGSEAIGLAPRAMEKCKNRS